MNLEDLSLEQKERALACKTPEEILALAKEEGYELSEDELTAVSGGGWICDGNCSDNSGPCPTANYC